MNAHVWQGRTPPNYTAVYMRRARLLKLMRADPINKVGAIEHYRTHPVDFINDWIDTYDPRAAMDPDALTHPPLVLFQRQIELVQFLQKCLETPASGLIEKSRDMGATWVCVAFSVWLWRFHPGAAIGWGSRKKDLVDQIGDPKSIFEKVRQAINGLPRDLWPKGFEPRRHMSSMRVLNPENGSTIIGEIGDEIGRGGRTLIYFKDESAHYERPELAEAALGQNTNVQIDISSVNGPGNVFHRKRMAGKIWAPGADMVRNRTNIFIFDWTENPLKNQAWYDDEREKKESEGLLHVFEQEVNRNYDASKEGILIPQAWVLAARNAHKRFAGMEDGPWRAGFDPYNEGRDKHALVKMKGAVIKYAKQWTLGDTGEATREVVIECRRHVPIDIQFDAIGIGAGVTAESNRLAKSEVEGERMPRGMTFIAYVASDGVLRPDEKVDNTQEDSTEQEGEPITNNQMFKNLKAQAHWDLRRKFERTWRAINKGETYSPMDMISIDTEAIPPDQLAALEQQLSQPVRKGGQLQIIVDKTPDGTDSPNLSDATVICSFPVSAGYVYDLSKSL